MSFLENVYDGALDKLDTLNQKGLDSFSSLKDLDERYSHFHEVNRGGLKKIVSTHDDVTDRLVAIAFLKEKNPAMESSFVHEARINAKLQHPNIIPVYDIGFDQERGPFFTMKLIEGKSLGQVLTSLRKRNHHTVSAYPQAEMVEIFRKICDAVFYAHNCGVIHLDLKPDNIQIGRFGEVLVCDWGMAKVLDEECSEEFISDNTEGLVNVTLNGEIKGTPGFMAPEQVKNRRKDQRTDIYGLGCILYSLLTWQVPIEGRDLETVLHNTAKGKYQSPVKRSPSKEIPESLNAVVLKCMQSSPSKRYQSVDEIIEEVDRYSRGFSTIALEAGFKKQIMLLYRRNSRICQTVFTAFLILSCIVSFFVINLNKERNLAIVARRQAENTERKARAIALDLQKEKDLKLQYSKTSLQETFKRMAATWQRGDHLNLGEVKEMINTCLALDSANRTAFYNLGHVAIVELDFKKATEFYSKGKGYDSKSMAEFCREKRAKFNSGEQASSEDLINLAQSLKKVNKTSIHRILSGKMIRGSDSLTRALELASGYFLIDNRHVKNYSVKEHYNEKNGVLNLKQMKNVDLRIVSLLDINGLDLSGSQVKLYPYREKNIHYSYLNFKDTNINGLPFSGKNLQTLYISSLTKSLSFLENCPVLEEIYLPKGKFSASDVSKFSKSNPRIIEY